jgi:ABC-2 type transport system permease protein
MNPKVILSLVLLRLKRVLRDRTNLIWLFLMPMVFSFLMGNMLGDWDGPKGDNRPLFMVYDADQGAASNALVAPLIDHERFRVIHRDTLASEAACRQRVDDEVITAALLIPEGYTQAVARNEPVTLRLFYDSDRLSSQSVRTLLDEQLLKLNAKQAALQVSRLPSNHGAQPFDHEVFDARWNEPRVTLESSVLGRLPDQGMSLTSSFQHVGPSYTIFFVMMFLMMSAKDLVSEREDRTLARLMVSRASSLDVVLGFFLGGMAVGLLQSGVLLTLNMLPPFQVDYGDSLIGLILVVVLFAGVCSAGSILLGSLARTGAQADGLGLAVTLVFAAMGGLWWPLEVVPGFMQAVGHGLPTGQAITVFMT